MRKLHPFFVLLAALSTPSLSMLPMAEGQDIEKHEQAVQLPLGYVENDYLAEPLWKKPKTASLVLERTDGELFVEGEFFVPNSFGKKPVIALIHLWQITDDDRKIFWDSALATVETTERGIRYSGRVSCPAEGTWYISGASRSNNNPAAVLRIEVK